MSPMCRFTSSTRTTMPSRCCCTGRHWGRAVRRSAIGNRILDRWNVER
jgi:hypothetical protein